MHTVDLLPLPPQLRLLDQLCAGFLLHPLLIKGHEVACVQRQPLLPASALFLLRPVKTSLVIEHHVDSLVDGTQRLADWRTQRLAQRPCCHQLCIDAALEGWLDSELLFIAGIHTDVDPVLRENLTWLLERMFWSDFDRFGVQKCR